MSKIGSNGGGIAGVYHLAKSSMISLHLLKLKQCMISSSTCTFYGSRLSIPS